MNAKMVSMHVTIVFNLQYSTHKVQLHAHTLFLVYILLIEYQVFTWKVIQYVLLFTCFETFNQNNEKCRSDGNTKKSFNSAAVLAKRLSKVALREVHRNVLDCWSA